MHRPVDTNGIASNNRNQAWSWRSVAGFENRGCHEGILVVPAATPTGIIPGIGTQGCVWLKYDAHALEAKGKRHAKNDSDFSFF
jgi:hypothetical protein